MQFQDKERTKPVNFLPKFADSQVIIQTITNGGAIDENWGLYYLQPDYPFLVTTMSMHTGVIFRSKPNDELVLANYGDYIP